MTEQLFDLAAEAGVGVGALYRRYASKEVLLQTLCSDGLERFIAIAEEASIDETDPWAALARFIEGIVDADVHSTMMPASMLERLGPRSRAHFLEFGPRVAGAYAMFPRMRNGGFRVDARPEKGFPGSDLGMVQEQLLDLYEMDYAVLTPMQPQGFGSEAPALAAGRASSIVWARTPPRSTTRLPARCSTPAAMVRRRPSAVSSGTRSASAASVRPSRGNTATPRRAWRSSR